MAGPKMALKKSLASFSKVGFVNASIAKTTVKVGTKATVKTIASAKSTILVSPYVALGEQSYLFCCLFYFLSFLCLFLRNKKISILFLGLGFSINLFSLIVRLMAQWPMQAPFQGPFWLTACLGALALYLVFKNQKNLGLALIPVVGFIAILAGLFPGDSYVPFPRSSTIFAHLSLFFISAGKSFFWASGAFAFLFLSGALEKQPSSQKRAFNRFIVWGFVLYTLGLFLAEIWAYMAWSSPVVWDDATMLTTMALWFFYGCYLHLYLQKTWNLRKRAWFALSGVGLLLLFALIPELGVFKMPEVG